MILSARNDIESQVGGEVIRGPHLDGSGNPMFKSESSLSAGYTDKTSLVNWDLYGAQVDGLTYRDFRDILITDFVGDWATLSDADKKTLIRHYVYDSTETIPNLDLLYTQVERDDFQKEAVDSLNVCDCNLQKEGNGEKYWNVLPDNTGVLTRIELKTDVSLDTNVSAGYFMTQKTSAPADGDLVNGEMALWIDETPITGGLQAKWKDSAGAVLNQTIGDNGLADGHALIADQDIVKIFRPMLDGNTQNSTSGSGSVSGIDQRSLSVASGTISGSSAGTTWAEGGGWQKGVPSGQIDWDKKISFAVSMRLVAGTPNGNSWMRYGGSSGVTAVSNFSMKSIGFRIDGDAIKGMADDGSVQDIVDLGVTLIVGQLTILRTVCDGLGNVEFFVGGGDSKGTSAGGPTGLETSGKVNPVAGSANNADADQQFIIVHDIIVGVSQ